jgi:hypothetical protein
MLSFVMMPDLQLFDDSHIAIYSDVMSSLVVDVRMSRVAAAAVVDMMMMRLHWLIDWMLWSLQEQNES